MACSFLSKQANQMLWGRTSYLKGLLSIIKRCVISCVRSTLSLISFRYRSNLLCYLINQELFTTFCAIFCKMEWILLFLRKLYIQVSPTLTWQSPLQCKFEPVNLQKAQHYQLREMTSSTLICKFYLYIVSRMQLIKHRYIFYHDRLCSAVNCTKWQPAFLICKFYLLHTTRIDAQCFQTNANSVYIFWKLKNSDCDNLFTVLNKEENKKVNFSLYINRLPRPGQESCGTKFLWKFIFANRWTNFCDCKRLFSSCWVLMFCDFREVARLIEITQFLHFLSWTAYNWQVKKHVL